MNQLEGILNWINKYSKHNGGDLPKSDEIKAQIEMAIESIEIKSHLEKSILSTEFHSKETIVDFGEWLLKNEYVFIDNTGTVDVYYKKGSRSDEIYTMVELYNQFKIIQNENN